MRVVAIDDEKKALKLLVDAISEALGDVEIFSSTSVDEVLDYMKINKCDIIFSDIQIGNYTGLELARRLKDINPTINIIFVTGYSEYLLDAIDLHVSGYIYKPVSASDIKNAMNNLLYPINSSMKGLYAKTFGNFDFLVDGSPLSFSKPKSKELLAYLIDRRGAFVSKRELIGILFEDKEYDRNVQYYFTKLYSSLVKTLENAGVTDLLVKARGEYRVDISKFTCDSYLFLDGKATKDTQFLGEYMSQYSWAEYLTSVFYMK